jgi:cyanophycinase
MLKKVYGMPGVPLIDSGVCRVWKSWKIVSSALPSQPCTLTLQFTNFLFLDGFGRPIRKSSGLEPLRTRSFLVTGHFMRFLLAGIMVLACAHSGTAQQKQFLGTVIAHGGGVLTESIVKTFREMCGKPSRLLVIPTADRHAGNEDFQKRVIEHWERLGFDEVAILHAPSRESANNPSFAAPIENAGCVWLGGGSQSRLEDTYVGTTVESALHALLNRGGVIAGSSAGAAIMSDIIIRSGNPEPKEGRGLALVPENIILDQHFLALNRESRLLRMLQRHPGRIGLGIDEGTALVFQGSRQFVLGKSIVMRCEDQKCINLDPLNPN